MLALISVSFNPARISLCWPISSKRCPAFVWASSKAAALESSDICIIFRWQLYSGTAEPTQAAEFQFTDILFAMGWFHNWPQNPRPYENGPSRGDYSALNPLRARLQPSGDQAPNVQHQQSPQAHSRQQKVPIHQLDNGPAVLIGE